MKKVYGLICDRGDGSSGLQWFTDKDEVDLLLDGEHDNYYANEGSPAVTLTFSDDFDLKAAGFRFL